MGPLPESNFPYKTAVKLQVFIFFKVFYKKLILWKDVFYTVNIRFFEVPGSHRLILFGVILGAFSIKILIKNRCKNDAEKVMKFDAKMIKNDANMGPKIMIFWVCLRKGDFMNMWVLLGKYRVFWGIAHQKSINNSSKNHQKIIKDSCSKKLCKKDGKVVQNGTNMGSKIA